MEKMLDAKGLTCPKPVILTKKMKWIKANQEM